MKEYFSTEEVCEILGKSRSTIYKYIKKGKLKTVRTDRGDLEISLKDLESFLGRTLGDEDVSSKTSKNITHEDGPARTGDEKPVTENKLRELIEEILSGREERLRKPVEEEALYIAGSLSKENEFLKNEN